MNYTQRGEGISKLFRYRYRDVVFALDQNNFFLLTHAMLVMDIVTISILYFYVTDQRSISSTPLLRIDW